MRTIPNSLYAALKKEGLPNWSFFNPRQSGIDFYDLEDMDFDDMDGTSDWLLLELEE